MSLCDTVIAALICNLCLVVVFDIVPCSSEPKLADSSPPARSALLTSILCDYDTRIRPSTHTTTKFALYIERATVDESSLLMETLAITEWNDDTLSWNPSDYDNIQKIDIKGAKIWRPPITTISTLPWSRDQTSQELWMGACDVTCNGTVLCLSAMEMGGDCQMDARYWPHVRSACQVYIGLDFRVDDNVHLEFYQNDTEDRELTTYSPTEDWLVTALRRRIIQFPDSRGLVYLVFLQKQGVVLAGTIALMVIVVCSLILTTFFLPVGSEFRFGLGCCAFFCLLVVAHISFENVLSVGGVTPIVVNVYRSLLLLAGLALLEPLVLSMLIPTEKKPPPPPRWLYGVRTWFLNSATGKTILTVLMLSPSNSEKTSQAVEMMLALHMQAGDSGGADAAASTDNADTEGDASDYVHVSSISEANAGPHKIWNFFVSILDRSLFVFYSIACLALSVVIIYAMLPFDKSHHLDGSEWSFI